MNLHRLCGSGFSLLLWAFPAKSCHFGVNWPTTLCENKDGVHFFTLKFECHNRYSKLLLCNSENCDIAWCNKKQFRMGLLCFFLITKSCFFSKKQKNRIYTNRWVVFLKKTGFSQPRLSFNPFCDFPLITRSGTCHVTIRLMTLRITGIWTRKN